jgi:hypothetical protein
MLRRLLGWRESSPLFDLLERLRPEATAVILERDRDNEADTELSVVVATLTMALAGDFLRGHSKRIEQLHGPFSRDVLAFETLTFFNYALRAHYEATEYCDYADDRYEIYFASFQNSAEIVRSLISKHLGSASEQVFVDRFQSYLRAPSVGGQQGATEQFRFTLLTLKGARLPAIDYGPVSLDLPKTLEMIGLVQAFSSAFLDAYRETLTNIIEEYRPAPDR